MSDQSSEVLGQYIGFLPDAYSALPLSSASALATVVQTAIVFFAALFALYQVSATHKTSRRTNTLHVILQNENDKDVLAHRKTFNALKRNSEKKLVHWLILDFDKDQFQTELVKLKEKVASDGKLDAGTVETEFKETVTANNTAIRSTLNRYEIIAISIKNNTLDSDMFKQYYMTTTIADWKASQEWIDLLRKKIGQPHAYIEFQALATAYEAEKNGNEIAQNTIRKPFINIRIF